MAVPIQIPLVNANEPEAFLAALPVSEGDPVEKDTLLCTLETTKSTQDIHSPQAGFVVALAFSEGDTVKAGEILAYIADTPEWTPPAQSGALQQPDAAAAVPANLRISKPALQLAQETGIDLSALPTGQMITTAAIRELAGQSTQTAQQPAKPLFDPTRLVIYGGGGHGKALIELIQVGGVYKIAGIIDDGIPAGEEILGIPILGGSEQLANLFEQGIRLVVNAVGGIGSIAVRIKVFESIASAGFACPSVVHPTAYLEPTAVLAPGCQVFPFAYVGTNVKLGFGAIVNTHAVVSHDCTIEDYANISPGALLAGEVHIGEAALVGMGVTVNLGVKIGARARIGNSAVIKADVPPGIVVRAGAVFPA